MLGVGFEVSLRALAPEVLGAVLRRYRDFDAAEDAVQEALLAAAVGWPRDGMPVNPRGWLIQVAFRRLTDQTRSDRARRRREETLAGELEREEALRPTPEPEDGSDAGDDSLLLLFMCCHPSLTPTSAIALTLRAVGGLTTSEIAKAFLVSESTMAQRISRAKQAIKASGVPFERPSTAEWPERLKAVLHVLYLMFNEGYAASAGAELQRADLADEAVRLTRSLARLLPDDGEVSALLALMLLTDARRRARTAPNGDLIPLDEQDRSLWDRARIDEGVALVSGALARGDVGPYQLQAAIAAIHDEAARAKDTDWRQILALYDVLESMSDNPVVSLNRAIALAMVEGPHAGLERLRALDADERLAGHHRLAAVRAHLLEMAGEHASAVEHYRAAAAHTTSLPEERYLRARADELEGAKH
ncbi:MAG TPA: RNA polymerase sigma factor [Polyangiaceae bacterium]|nr:RNA polymerase sigma factor [Polyangiaceae bacterium]